MKVHSEGFWRNTTRKSLALLQKQRRRKTHLQAGPEIPGQGCGEVKEIASYRDQLTQEVARCLHKGEINRD